MEVGNVVRLFVGRVDVFSEKATYHGYKSIGVGMWCYNDVTDIVWYCVMHVLDV